MNNKEQEALATFFGEKEVEVIEAWCNVSQSGNISRWIRHMLLEEISECWSEDTSDYSKIDLRDKLTLDRFFRIGSFRERTVTAAPKICPDCQAPIFPSDQCDCPITRERQQVFDCCRCNWQMSIALADLETHPECD